MRHSIAVGFSLMFAAAPLLAGNAGQAIAEGRRLLAAHDCRAATRVLQDALPDAGAVAGAKQSADAVAAIHFYSALAMHECRQASEAKDELREFFRVHDGASKLDPAKYPRGFIALFDAVQQEQHGAAAPADASFERFYRGFTEGSFPAPRPRSLVLWGTSPEFAILATAAEHDAWDRLGDDDARARFIDDFWRKRDRDPETEENAYRDEVMQRIAFAASAFREGNDGEGALSDRGKVFVLLGVPSRVYRKPLTRGDGAFIPQRSPILIDGSLEQWIYFREQLPHPIPAYQVEFRFITQEGYGDNVMQKDSMPLRALAAARETR
jgi:GWxTD domain-containing protein